MKLISKINLQALSFLIISRSNLGGAKYIRSSPSGNMHDDGSKVRQLDWNFIGYIFNDDGFFSNYDKDEIPSLVSGRGESGDRDDYLRIDDVCVGKDGSISKSNCKTPPSCDKTSSVFGRQKLCINRAFEPGNTNSWYVVAMKCIPEWENCDKCFCGYMKQSYALTGYCKFDESSVNDDRVDVDCDKIEKINMMGRTFNYKSQGSDEEDDKNKNSDSDNKDKNSDDENMSSDTSDNKQKNADTSNSKDKSSDTSDNKKKSSDTSDNKKKSSDTNDNKKNNSDASNNKKKSSEKSDNTIDIEQKSSGASDNTKKENKKDDDSSKSKKDKQKNKKEDSSKSKKSKKQKDKPKNKPSKKGKDDSDSKKDKKKKDKK